jgi:hypothetical protein
MEYLRSVEVKELDARIVLRSFEGLKMAFLHESPDRQPPCPRGGRKSEHGASVSKLSGGAEENKPAGVNLNCEL